MIRVTRQCQFWLVIAALYVACTHATASEYAGWTPEARPTGIIPEPQAIYRPAGAAEGFSFSQQPLIYVEHDADRVGAEDLAKDLERRFGIQAKIVDALTGTPPDIALVRTGSTAYPRDFPAGSEVDNEEGYRLLVDADRIVIEGAGPRGVLYGAQTLRQMIDAEARVAPVFVRDWPEMPWRVSYAGVFGPETIREHIHRAVRMKMNAVILETRWVGTRNWWFSPSPQNRPHAEEFFDLCRKYHIEPIPLIQGMGWGYGVTDLDPMTTEAIWYEDEELVLHYDRPGSLSRPNVVATDSAPILVRSLDGRLYEEGTDYTVIRGKTVRPYAKDNEAWKIESRRDGEIDDGEIVLVSYNAVEPGPHKAYCPSEPRSYKIIDRAIDYVMTTYKPRFVHLGADEVWQVKSCSRCLQSGKSAEQLVLDDLLYRYNRVREHDPETQIMVWYDQIRTTGDKKRHIGTLLPSIDELPEDIIVCPWIYRAGEKYVERIDTEIAFELDHGFRVLGTSAGYFTSNMTDWHDALATHRAEDGNVLGMIFSYWGSGGLQKSFLPAAASLMWSGSKVNRDLFSVYGAITTNIREYGLMLTFPWDTQMPAVAAWYNKQLEEGRSPNDIARMMDEKVLPRTAEFEKRYGSERWKALRYAPLPEQQAGMVQKLSELVHLMGEFVTLRGSVSSGGNEASRASYRELIGELHRMGYLTYAERSQLLELLEESIPTSMEIFGSDIGTPPADLEIGSDKLSQLEVVTDLDDVVLKDDEYRIYFIGNSITRHGYNQHTIDKFGWGHQAGMAASSEEKDYAHRLGTMLATRMPDTPVRIYFGPGSNPIRALNELDQAKSFQPNLVIVQLGENIKKDMPEDRIRERYRALLGGLQALESEPLVIVVGTWAPQKGKPYDGRVARIDAIKRELCEAKGLPFVSVEQYAIDPACSGTGKSWQVRWHPNDQGHAGYAKEIYESWQAANEYE